MQPKKMNIEGIHAADAGCDDGDGAPEWPQALLGKILGRYIHGMYSAIARCRGSPEACEQGGRHGFRVFAPLAPRFAPKVVLLSIITVDRRGV